MSNENKHSTHSRNLGVKLTTSSKKLSKQLNACKREKNKILKELENRKHSDKSMKSSSTISNFLKSYLAPSTPNTSNASDASDAYNASNAFDLGFDKDEDEDENNDENKYIDPNSFLASKKALQNRIDHENMKTLKEVMNPNGGSRKRKTQRKRYCKFRKNKFRKSKFKKRKKEIKFNDTKKKKLSK